MYDLKSIMKQNAEAEAAGILPPGSAVGTTGYTVGTSTLGHRDTDGGLRGHSIGPDYPWSIQPRIDGGITKQVVYNYATGYESDLFATWDEAAAHMAAKQAALTGERAAEAQSSLIDLSIRVGYTLLTGQGWMNPRAFAFRRGGYTLVASIEAAPQHPEGGGYERVISDRAGVVQARGWLVAGGKTWAVLADEAVDSLRKSSPY